MKQEEKTFLSWEKTDDGERPDALFEANSLTQAEEIAKGVLGKLFSRVEVYTGTPPESEFE